jgi:hypothetical protein
MKRYFTTASDNYLDLSKYNNIVSRGEHHTGFRIEKANGTKINFSDIHDLGSGKQASFI